MTMPSDDDSKNPFVRFKEHVDANISAGLHNVLNFPSLLSDTVTSSRQLSPHDSRSAVSRQPDSEPTNDSDDDVPPHFRRWLSGQRHAAAEEQAIDAYYSRIASNYPGDENEAVRDIIWSERFDAFAQSSQYSPLCLAERMPRQPVPADIEVDMDARLFTYVDAFEDLLAEAGGKPTMDLRARYNMNRMLRRTWGPFGETPAAWARRLEAQGLVKAFVPDYRALPAPPKSAARQAIEQPGEEDGEVAQGNEWRGYRKQDARHKEQKQSAEDGLFGEIEKAVKMLNKVLDESTSITSSFWEAMRTEKDREPDTESDLYEAVECAFSAGQRSLSAFFKSLAEGIEPRPRSGAKSVDHVPAGEIVEEEDGMKTVKSTREYVDEYGNKHVSTEIRRTNKEGSVVSTETHYSVRPASKAEKASVAASTQPREETKHDEWEDKHDEWETKHDEWETKHDKWEDSYDKHTGDRKSGWFWK